MSDEDLRAKLQHWQNNAATRAAIVYMETLARECEREGIDAATMVRMLTGYGHEHRAIAIPDDGHILLVLTSWSFDGSPATVAAIKEAAERLRAIADSVPR